MGCTSSKSGKPDKEDTNIENGGVKSTQKQPSNQPQRNPDGTISNNGQTTHQGNGPAIVNVQSATTQQQTVPNSNQSKERPSEYLNNQTPTKKPKGNQFKNHNNQPPDEKNDENELLGKGGKDGNTASVDNIRQFYKIGKILGTGSFGSVRLCSSRYEGTRKYALKTIAKERMGTKVYMLRRELEILKALDHPNIVKFYEIYMDDMYIHFVMEYCEGGDLYNRLITNGPFEEEIAKKIIEKLISALIHMHQKDVVHRDLKPENILFVKPLQELADKSKILTKDQQIAQQTDIKIIDFGLSRIFQPDQLKGMPSIVGTPLYVAPEIIEEKIYGRECDCWSLGVVAYTLLSGKEPFFAKSIGEVYEKIRKADYQFEGEMWDKISVDAKDFISKLLVADPKKRMDSNTAKQHQWFQRKSNALSNMDYKKAKIVKKDVKNLLAFNINQKKSKLRREAIKILTNHHLTNQEYQNLQETFRMLDVNRRGELTLQEMCDGMRSLGLNNQEEAMKKFYKDIHGDQDDPSQLVLNYSEFLSAAINLQQYLNEEKLWSLFRYFDHQDQGYFTVEDIKSAIARGGRKISDTQLEEMMNELGESAAGKITFKKFKELMKPDNVDEGLIEKASSLLVDSDK